VRGQHEPAQAAQGAGEVMALPIFDDLDDEAIDVACTAGSIYRVDFMRAYTALRDWCPHYTVPEQPAAGADAPPAQPAPVVPDGVFEIITQARDSICAGGLSTNAQHERSIVEPYLDGILDELRALDARAPA
jgi:hypothetical protein